MIKGIKSATRTGSTRCGQGSNKAGNLLGNSGSPAVFALIAGDKASILA